MRKRDHATLREERRRRKVRHVASQPPPRQCLDDRALIDHRVAGEIEEHRAAANLRERALKLPVGTLAGDQRTIMDRAAFFFCRDTISRDYLKAQGGFMPVTDKNPPEEIHALFGVSKKTYKKAIGALYKQRMITFENEGTKLVG